MPPTSRHSAASGIMNIGSDRGETPRDVNRIGMHHIMKGIAMIVESICRRALKYTLIRWRLSLICAAYDDNVS